MRAKLAKLGMSMIVVFTLVIGGLAVPYFNRGNTTQPSATNLSDATAGETLTQNANTGMRRSPRRSRRKGNANTGAATAATPDTTSAPAEQMTPPATGKMSSTKGKRKGGGKGGRKMMMSGVPSGVENCLNHLAQMAASDPLIDYEGHPSEIINNGLLWSDPKSKCSVTDQGQRQKIFALANAWRMKDAAKVRSLLSELGATGTSGTN